MKNSYSKKLLCCLVLFLIAIESKAQFVTIPDPVFVSYLQTNFPLAMSGNQMDTTHISIVQYGGDIDVHGMGINSIEGIQYFDKMTSLRCQTNQLTFLPQLPNTISLLFCGANNLTSLGTLPDSLSNLICDSNQLTSLPTLPSKLSYLICASNQITNLSYLPPSLGFLNAMDNQLTCLPQLPDILSTLLVAGNAVSCLPNIPTYPGFSSDIGTTICNLPGSYFTTNVSCNGSCDGSLSTSLGFPYTFLWSNGSTAPSQVNLCADPIYLVLTDPNACAYIDTFNIIQPTAISLTLSTISATCGSADGSVILSVTGGVSPYQYSIDGGITYQVQDTFGNLVSGLYTVQVEDANGCFAFANAVVSSIGGPVIVSLQTTDLLCNGDSSGSIVANVAGGTAPFQYSLDSGLTFQSSNTFSNLSAGNYYVVVKDAVGCFATNATTILQPPILVATIATTTNVSCNGADDGSLIIVAIGGTPPYMYAVNGSPFQPNNVLINLVTGIYTIVVMDANGCTAIANATITEPPLLTFGLLQNVTVCNGNPVLLCVNPVGGTPAYNYLWSTSGFTNCELVAGSGVYTVTVTDANGCTASISITVTYSQGWQFASVTNLILPTCGLCDGSAEAIMINTQAATYQWMPGNITTAINSQLCDKGNNTLIVTDTAGCVDTVNFKLSCHSVWPGDANNDGQADNVDLLAIGIGYGISGEVRYNATINWQAEIGLDWNDSLASGTNYKHIDCNGDGIIADDDTIAIIQNFGLTHPLRPAIIPATLTDPPLYFDIQIDSSNVDTVLQIPIMLGTAAIPATDVYGIAFTIGYDTSLVKADSITMNYISCWMDNATAHTIGIAINDPINGKMYAAVTRTSHTDTTGYGELGRMGVVTVDNISARMNSLYADTLIFTLSDVVMISQDEQYKTVNIINDTLILNDNTVDVNEYPQPFRMNVYPNPATRFLFIDFDTQLRNPIISLQNMLTEEIKINYRINSEKAIVDLGNVTNGIYLLSVKTDKGIVNRKINIQKP